MRPAQLADLEIAARVVAVLPARERLAMIKQLCDQAQIADEYREISGKPHPKFGNGTLMSAAFKHAVPPRAALCDRALLTSLAALCAHLAEDHAG
jgi:hypothetical protein